MVDRIPVVLRHSDGTILDLDGRELFLGLDRFKALVQDQHRCFLCGVDDDSWPFNDEHVIPDWVQRSYGLRNKAIQLWNGTSVRYPQYRIRCCVECNSFLGKTFEHPIADALSRGPNYFLDWYRAELFRIFLWLNLIFLKVHLKDNQLRFERDERAPATAIGEFYDWSELHHCHALLRATRFGFGIDIQSTLGSVFCLQLGEWARKQPYDYNDHLPTHTVMIRLGEVAFICALNDSRGVIQGLEPKFENLPPDMNPLQFMEMLTEFQFVNAHLKYRPKYMTKVEPRTGEVTIIGQIPDLFDLHELDFSIRGELMIRNLYGCFGPSFSLNGLSVDETRAMLATGDVTFMGNR